MISEIKENELSKVIADNSVNVVIVEKPQCPHCLKTIAGIETILSKYTDKVSFHTINVLESESLNEKYQITAAPTILFFKDGNLVNSRSGYTHPLVIEDTLERIL